jgi:hypothetical protein
MIQIEANHFPILPDLFTVLERYNKIGANLL